MKNIHSRLTFLAIFMLSACATPYVKDGLVGGYSHSQLDERIYLIRFQGNTSTSSGRAKDLLLLRSAELTLEKGFTYFSELKSSEHNEITGFVHGPTTIQQVAPGTIHGLQGPSAAISKPSAEYIIEMHSNKPSGAISYNAKIICSSIGGKYKVTCGKPSGTSEMLKALERSPRALGM